MVAGSTGSWLDGTAEALRPPPRLSLSEWADKHYRLSPESSAQPGKWHARAYQRGILDAIADPAVERVSVQKSARVGYTLCINAAIAYHMHHDPCPIMVVQPTVETAKKYSKEFIAPMFRDVEVLAGLVKGAAVKSSGRTILDKSFPGGVLSMVGANSGTGFRMSSRRVVIFDEVDGYRDSAGDEGDPIALGEARAREYWNRKIIAGSTPTIAGASRIEELFEAGDRRRFYVPCPQCGHMDVLRFRKRKGDETDGGHRMRWPDDHPEEACFECAANGCVIEERHKSAMLEAGEWRAEAPGNGTVNGRAHASFHIWAAYSLSANATWGQIAQEFAAATKLKNNETLKAVVNTLFGETWQERGEAPEWEGLYLRREPYAIGTVPEGVIALTAGVDVQKDRLVPEVVGWGANKESWSILIDEIPGDTALLTGEASPWIRLNALLARTFQGADGRVFTISMMAVDGGWQTEAVSTQVVYAWGRQHPRNRVIVTKGVYGPRALVETATPVDVTIGGKKIQRGYRVWPIGVDGAKAEFYSLLRLVPDIETGAVPPGYCHFPEHPAEYFRQITAEHLMKIVKRRTGRARLEWQTLPNRENHYLDARILARAAAALLGIDRMARPPAALPAPPPAASPATSPSPPPSPPDPPRPRSLSSFWGKPRGSYWGRRR